MSYHIAKGEEFTKTAEEKLQGWGIFGSNHEDAAQFFDKAANSFKLGKSWNLAGATYVKLACCYTKLDSTHEAANAYADAAHCYKKDNIKEAVPCLQQSVNLFLELGRLNMAARCYKEIAELYEQEGEQNQEQVIAYYEKAAELFQSEDVNISANLCRQKIAHFAVEIDQYAKAIEIYEDIARQSLKNNLLKYGVKSHLLNAGICQLCKGGVVAMNNALDLYQDLDPTFSGTPEYRLLADLAAAIDEEDEVKFTSAVQEYDKISEMNRDEDFWFANIKGDGFMVNFSGFLPLLVYWRRNLISRANPFKAEELDLSIYEEEEDDLT
ncbi:membrane traffic protein [Lithospermum erythrorhizon]|uniref:Membrane traffic protein n=1 Tax=Lithospermum erythrorhizon TaxID=34254 RepID=A0AAV3NV17_LITER